MAVTVSMPTPSLILRPELNVHDSAVPQPFHSPVSDLTPAATHKEKALTHSTAVDELNFDDVSQSFHVKTTYELLRSLVVFKLCSIRPLVVRAQPLLALSERMLGRRLTHWILRHTFFAHFCAGENAGEVSRVTSRLSQSGLGSILDYAAEADLSHVQKPRDRTGIQSARTYEYEGEEECEANAAICRACIETAAVKGDGNGFAAIKLTALGKPELLEHLSNILTHTKKLFYKFASSTLDGVEAQPDQPLLITFPQFQAGLHALQVTMDESSARALFDRIDMDRSGSIDLIEWVTFLDPRQLGRMSRHFRAEGMPTLDQDSLAKVNAMMRRLEGLAQLAADKRVRLMIDAEQSYFQPAIDHMVLQLQRQYNRDFPVIFNTYQCYLRDIKERIAHDLERSQREGWKFAAKLVRGAYMVQERKRAKETGYDDPIQPTLQHTHDSYHEVASMLLHHPSRPNIMIASHNESSVRYVTSLMSRLGIPRRDGGVFFGQLLGMCDHVSFSLGHCGYAVYKYVPYGPIGDVLPYLVRRAQENSAVLGGAEKERRLIRKELTRRMGITS